MPNETLLEQISDTGELFSILNGMRLSDPVLGDNPEQFNPDRFIGNPYAKLPYEALLVMRTT